MKKEITVLFPALFGELSSPWDDEYELAKKVGFNVLKIDEETLNVKKDLSEQLVIYRGWMMSNECYSKLLTSVSNKGGEMITTLDNFRNANKFSFWYDRLSEFTMNSITTSDFSELDKLFKENKSFFIKDELKSLGDGKSIANSKEEAIEIYNKIKASRDFSIKDNQMCLREVISLDNEERFFTINGKVIGTHQNKERINFVEKIANIALNELGLSSISIDVASSNSEDILIEIGDFQVSDMNKDGNLEFIEQYFKILKNELV